MDSITAQGHVEASLVAPDGTVRVVECGHNTILYRCADAVARLFAGEAAYRPAKIGFVTADFSLAVADARGTSPSTLAQLNAEDVPLETGYSFATADSAKYANNKVTFRAMTTNSTTVTIYGFLLKDADGRVLAVKKLGSPVARQDGFVMAISWTVQFS